MESRKRVECERVCAYQATSELTGILRELVPRMSRAKRRRVHSVLELLEKWSDAVRARDAPLKLRSADTVMRCAINEVLMDRVDEGVESLGMQ